MRELLMILGGLILVIFCGVLYALGLRAWWSDRGTGWGSRHMKDEWGIDEKTEYHE